MPKVTLERGRVRLHMQIRLRLTRLLSLHLVKTAELNPYRHYLVGFHPHGVLATGDFVNLCTESTGFPELFPCISPHLMMLPLWFRLFSSGIISCQGVSLPLLGSLGR